MVAANWRPLDHGNFAFAAGQHIRRRTKVYPGNKMSFRIFRNTNGFAYRVFHKSISAISWKIRSQWFL